ncbi:nudix hydrolase 18, mitochondrial [Malania oleifera]|uniref:nudix hydrolase 18, mitochondrial n=1 Tax=Malania oleifera TaxID=397392 RepID=UPI0025AE48A6|nr:nudix hydrolase 18, mitochondrial [Malania oleifera]
MCKDMVGLVSRTGRQLQRYNMGRRQVVGCIPYRYTNGSEGTPFHELLEVLVISSQKGHGILFPKGGWETDETVEEAAARESLEEAGVLGILEVELGKWSFKSRRHGTIYEGYMFPLLVKEVLDSWPEENLRQRKWMPVHKAREACEHWWMKEALDRFVNRLESPSQDVQTKNHVSPCSLS